MQTVPQPSHLAISACITKYKLITFIGSEVGNLILSKHTNMEYLP